MDFFLSHLPRDTSEQHLKRFFNMIGNISCIDFVPQEEDDPNYLLAIVTVEVKREFLKKIISMEKEYAG